MKNIDNLANIAAQYNVLLCDIWGVLHNGKSPYESAPQALNEFRSSGGKVVLISNAPRPAASVEGRLREIGVAPCYDAICTSGDLARGLTQEYFAAGRRGCFVGAGKDAPLLAGLDFTLPDARTTIAAKEYDYVLLSGLYDDQRETPQDYTELLAAFHAQNLTMICANPDRVVQFGERVIYCGGAVAEVYEQGGGEVVWVGKPYPAVYAYARKIISGLVDESIDDKKILAIGDGTKTDMVGAAAAGLDALFISGGLAQAQNALNNIESQAQTDLAALLAQENTHAKYVMQYLVW